MEHRPDFVSANDITHKPTKKKSESISKRFKHFANIHMGAEFKFLDDKIEALEKDLKDSETTLANAKAYTGQDSFHGGGDSVMITRLEKDVARKKAKLAELRNKN